MLSPGVLEAAKSTKVLHLAHEGLDAVPAAVWGLTGLVRLDLGYNEITALPPEIGQLTSLQELWLNGNPITGLPTEIEACQNLRFVDLRETSIYSLPKELSRLPKIADIALTQEMLTGPLAAAYGGGTRSLMRHLAHEDVLRDLKGKLRHTLNVLVYLEVSTTARGSALIQALVEQVIQEFPDFKELRLVIRNAERLFPADLDIADAKAIRKRFVTLQTENAMKKLAADVELKIRALYFDRIRVETVEGMVKSIYAHVTRLQDLKFLLHFATKLFPDDPRDVSGELLLANIQALRKQRAEERAAAVTTLSRALCALYPDQEPPRVEAVAASMAKNFKSVGDIKLLAADAPLFFPGEFTTISSRRVLRAFEKAQAEKAAML